MNVNIDRLLAVLATVTDPHTHKKLKFDASTCEVREQNGELELSLKLPYTAYDIDGELRQRIATALRAEGLTLGRLHLQAQIGSHAVQPGQRPLPNVRNIIAVASGKGGVGKSTTSVNLALALHMQGARVGLLDADIYGPSVPTMLGLRGKPKALEDNQMEPLIGHGLQANSIGFIIDEDAPAIWRGPMVTQALTQLLTQTRWNNLDYLIIDMPPGTGDIALTLAQKVPVTASVIVTTPQDLALIDAKRGLAMFQKVNIPVLGIVENMSLHICSQCGHEEAIFGQHGGRDMATEFNVPWLGALPLNMSIRSQTDAGTPTVIAAPDSAEARLYQEIATRVSANISVLPPDTSAQRPKVVPRPL